MSHLSISATLPAATAEQQLPAFVRQRMDEHYVERIEKL